MAENMKTVWVVEQGQYSDYRVVGVFTSKENADLVVETMNATEYQYGDTASVAAWPLDPTIAELRAGYVLHDVQMHKDGTVESVQRATDLAASDICGNDEGAPLHVWRQSTAPPNTPDSFSVRVWAKDDAHAIKIANEHRARLIATGAWTSDAVHAK